MKRVFFFLAYLSAWPHASNSAKSDASRRVHTLTVNRTAKVDIVYALGNANVESAIKLVQRVLKDDDFYSYITRVPDFDYTSESSVSIAEYIRTADLKLRIRHYKPKNPNSNTTAYVSSEYPNTIFLNSLKLNARHPTAIASTIVHEIVHLVDKTHDNARFGHGGNSSEGKGDSAPYKIGSIARCMARGDNDCASTNKALAPGEEEMIIAEGEELDDDQVDI